MAIVYVTPGAPSSTSAQDGQSAPQLGGKQSDAIVSQMHGRHWTANYRGRLFGASAAAVTIPLTSSNQTSIFTLWNPPGSGVVGELVETTIAQVVASTVINTVGWYAATAALTAAGTFTTKGTVQSQNIGLLAVGQIQMYTAYTHSSTQTIADIVGNFAATIDTGANLPTKFYDGRLAIQPGIAMSIMMSTAAGSVSGNTIFSTWAEWPV